MRTTFKLIAIFLLPIAILTSCRYSQEEEAMRRLERAISSKGQHEQLFLQRVDQLKNELRLWSELERCH